MSSDAQETTKWGNRPPLHRRQYIVDKPFQFRLIGTLLAIWFANSLFFTVVLYFFYEGHLTYFYELVPRPGMLPLMTVPGLFATAIAFIALFGVIVLGIVGLYLSNQIAGPLYRTKKSLERIGHGDLNFQLQFRQGDFLNDFPAIFNGMIEKLREQGVAEAEELKSLEEGDLDPAEMRKRLRQLRIKKEGQLGLLEGGNAEDEREAVSVAVH